jgi:uncharacterized protein (TIGR02118 family)
MAVSVQVIYPITEGTTFDYDYYADKHMKLVDQTMGPHLQSMVVTKGLAGGPDTPPDFFAVATFVFADEAAMNAAMANSGALGEDLANFTNVAPKFLIGAVIA